MLHFKLVIVATVATLTYGFCPSFLHRTPSLRSSLLSHKLASGAPAVMDWAPSSRRSVGLRSGIVMSGMLPPRRDGQDDNNNERDLVGVGLPLGLFRSDNGTRDSEFGISKTDNPYTTFLASLAPGEMVGQFMNTAPPRVQTAVKNTVLGLLGSLRSSPAFEANIVTSQKALASLMFQLEMTGYMFRNAEYRLGLLQSLNQGALPPGMESANKSPKISGKISVGIGDGKEVQVDAESYVAELRKEVLNLRNELVNLNNKKMDQEAQDLLAYVQKLEAKEMQALTGSISPEVLRAMKDLVDTVIQGMGGELAALMGPETLTEVPASVLAQLCMWQLVVGYNLREIEAREELRKQLPEA